MTTQTIGTLECGRPPDELAADFPGYPTMVSDWLAMPGARYTNYAIIDGELPADPRECDLWVITGSRFGVYEDHAWIAPLEGFIRAVRDAGGLMLGICFGHQLIAQALGGKVVKSDKGWGLGVHGYAPVDWPETIGVAPRKIKLQAFHQDQVISAPEGAHTVATSEFCRHGALWYPGFALTVQAHPEFSAAYLRALLTLRRGSSLPEDVVDAALTSLAQSTTRADLAAMIRSHIKSI